jgi:hypothetical protein
MLSEMGVFSATPEAVVQLVRVVESDIGMGRRAGGVVRKDVPR